MLACDIAEKLGFKLLAGDESEGREVKELYTCDLLSWVMGRAKADSMWFTVMGNLNAIAVAALADISAIVLVEGSTLDDDAKERANQRGICVYSCNLDCVSAILKVNEIL